MIVISSARKRAYIEELAVCRRYGRKGLGTRLLCQAFEWSRENRLRSIFLSTFAHVPWNAPFYRKAGFSEVDPRIWTSAMKRIRLVEKSQGLKVAERVFMTKPLS